MTGAHGRFVKAHLIPNALTRPEKPGLPFIENRNPARPVRRWSSWYDDQLVTKHGEEILTELDTWAIGELRKHRLIWSGWGSASDLQDGDRIPGTPWGLRKVKISNPKRLRLFFLSLLWRAAASNRFEFGEVVLPSEDLENLRQMLLNENPEPPSFYPAMLTQISTLGVIHNLVPLAQIKIVPSVDGGRDQKIPIFRFYFDGLVAHVHRQSSDSGVTAELGPMVVGGEADLVISTVTYEHSFERTNLDVLRAEAFRLWPDVLAKL